MVTKVKVKNNLSDNILYLQEADAKALGIIEGSAQKVFVDGREVEVVFVDEHEVVPVSNEDKKIYQDAYKIAEKYLQASSDENSPAWNALVTNNASARKIANDNYDYSYNPNVSKRFSFRDSWENFKGLFRRSNRNQYQASGFNYEQDFNNHDGANLGANQRSMIKYRANGPATANAQYNAMNQRHAQHSIRNDVFTKEELEIIQNVIDKSKGYDAAKIAAGNTRPQQTSNAGKISKVKTTTHSKTKSKK